VRVTTVKPSAIDSALIYNRTIRIGSPAELTDVLDLVSNEDVVDIQATEGVAFEAYEQLGSAAEFQHAPRWSGRTRVMDKANLPGLLDGAPIKVPDQVLTPVDDARAIIERLGLPVVVKPRTGVSGDGVQVLETLGAVEDAIREVGSTSDHLFEQYVSGIQIGVGGVVTGATEGELVAYELVARCGNQFSPARRIRMVDKPKLSETIHALVPYLGIAGLLNFQFIRDEDGFDWLHDVNPRVWGPFASLGFAGFDVIDAYVHWLRGIPWSLHAPVGGNPEGIGVFPYDFRPRDGEKMDVRSVLRLLGASARFTTWVGPRYPTSTMARSSLKTLDRWRS